MSHPNYNHPQQHFITKKLRCKVCQTCFNNYWYLDELKQVGMMIFVILSVESVIRKVTKYVPFREGGL